jgi:hypothetical protein
MEYLDSKRTEGKNTLIKENTGKGFFDSSRTYAENAWTTGEQKQILPLKQDNRSKEYLATGEQKQRNT